MTSTTNPFVDALAQFSKIAFAEIENQSRELLRAASETHEAKEEMREARTERDKVARDLRAAKLDAQGWKQDLAQAELTIAHLGESIQSQRELIAQLHREMGQWKDQSKNWQNHFLRVEQERCIQSSRIDELVKLQYAHPTNTTAIPSPIQPPSYKSAAPLSTSDVGSCSDSSPPPAKSKQTNQGTTLKRQRDVPLENPSEELPQTVQHPNSSLSKRTKVSNPNIATSSQRQDPQTPAASRTTLIRRVQAVIRVKREESDEDEIIGANKRPSRRSRKVIEDVEQDYLAADGNPICESRHLRHRNTIVNYLEEVDEEDDEDELTMGAEENHEEVYGTQRVETLDAQRSKQQSYPVGPPPPKKRRKVAAR